MAIAHINGQPWAQQGTFNDSYGGLSGWGSGANGLSVAVAMAHSLLTKDRVYVIGGINAGGSTVSTVQYAAVSGGGAVGTWSTGTSLPGNFAGGRAIATKDHVYLLAGFAVSAAVATIYAAPVDSSGVIGTWAELDPGMPATKRSAAVFVTKDRLFVAGGLNSSNAVTNTVHSCLINADGTLGEWTSSGNLNSYVSSPAFAVIGGYAYIFGGSDAGGAPSSVVQRALVASDGTLGTWAATTSLFTAVTQSVAISSGGRVWLLGGLDAGYAGTAYVQTAPVDGDGVIGAWALGASMSAVRRDATAVATSSLICVLGGKDGSNTATSTSLEVAFSGGLDDYLDRSYETLPDTAYGNLAPMLPSYSGYGTTTGMCDGDYSPPMAMVVSQGDTPVVSVCNYSPGLPLISSATPLLSACRYSPPGLSGYAIVAWNAIAGVGRYKPIKDKVSGYSYSGLLVSDVVFVPGMGIFAGTGSTPVVGRGTYSPRQSVCIGEASSGISSQWASCSFGGYTPVIAATAFDHCFGRAEYSPRQPVYAGGCLHSSFCEGAFSPKKPKMVAFRAQSSGGNVLAYSPRQVTSPTIPVTSKPTILSFSRG